MKFSEAVKHLQDRDCEGIMLPIDFGEETRSTRYFLIILIENTLTYAGVYYPEGDVLVKIKADSNVGMRITAKSVLSEDWALYKSNIPAVQITQKSTDDSRRIKVKNAKSEDQNKKLR
jgi:hypothetical protein